MPETPSTPDNFLVRTVRLFLTSQLSIILIIVALCLGVAAVLVTPREEEPQIVVPLADVYITAPGATPVFTLIGFYVMPFTEFTQ